MIAASDRISRAFNRSGATRAVVLEALNLRLLTGFNMLVFFKKFSLMEFQVIYLAIFLLFSVTDSFEWFWVESLPKNIQLMLEFLKAPLLNEHFSYYTLMTFLMMDDVMKYDQASDLWQILELISELESDI